MNLGKLAAAATNMMPTDDDLQRLIADGKQYVEEFLSGGKQFSLPPHLVIDGVEISGVENGEPVLKHARSICDLNLADWNSDIGKKVTMKNLAAALYREHVIPLAAMLCSEVWMAATSPTADGTAPNAAQRGWLRPEDAPNRRECILLAVLTCDKRTLRASREVVRDEADRIIWDGDWTDSSNDRIGILEQLFCAYYAFTKHLEDPDAYSQSTSFDSMEEMTEAMREISAIQAECSGGPFQRGGLSGL
jgi:hypothetical protein